MTVQKGHFIRWFEEITLEDLPLVGGKNASLGEMYRELTPKGIKIPHGFAVTAEAYWKLLEEGGILAPLQDALAGITTHDVATLATSGKRARDLILSAGIRCYLDRNQMRLCAALR